MSLTQWPRRLSRKIKANHWIYLVLHFVILLVGLLLVVYGNTFMQSRPLISAIALSVSGSLIAAAFAGWVLFLNWYGVWMPEERRFIIRSFHPDKRILKRSGP